MLGYFGKNGIVTPPPAAAPGVTQPKTTGVPAATARAELTSPAPAASPVHAPVPIQAPAPAPAPVSAAPSPAAGPSENQEIAMQLSQLRAAVDAKREEKESEVRSVREMQQKQAAYGRDVEQVRPPKAGYATEAEKLMGGQTGYARPMSGLGSLVSATQQVADLTSEITRLTAVVKQLTKDVAMGVVPRSELLKAVKDLQSKSVEAKQLATQLSGWADDGTSVKLVKVGLLAAMGFGIYKFLIQPRLAGSMRKRAKKHRNR